MAMHRIGLLEGGTGCAGLLSRALPPGLWARCHPAQAGGVYDLLLVALDWCGPLPAGLTCRALLWPGRLGPLTEALEAGWVVSYGLALQREVVTLAGRSLEPQEVPLRGFAGVAPELVLAWAGVLLLAGIPPEKLPASRA